MSTVECYDLHIYCDHPDCDEGTQMQPWGPAFGQFTGHDQAQAYASARLAGWVINIKREGELHGGAYARCPVHASDPPHQKNEAE